MPNSKVIRIACLEQFSGRNIGDSISLDCIMDRIQRRVQNAVFDVYSYRGGHRRFPKSNHMIRFIDLMPWQLTLNYLGLPALMKLPQADWVLSKGRTIFL